MRKDWLMCRSQTRAAPPGATASERLRRTSQESPRRHPSCPAARATEPHHVHDEPLESHDLPVVGAGL
jgi:hypothetical protein